MESIATEAPLTRDAVSTAQEMAEAYKPAIDLMKQQLQSVRAQSKTTTQNLEANRQELQRLIEAVRYGEAALARQLESINSYQASIEALEQLGAGQGT